MTCLQPAEFDLFIAITGLAHNVIGKLVLVHSEQPALWQIVDGMFCFSRGVSA
jgi:hypothetical protein